MNGAVKKSLIFIFASFVVLGMAGCAAGGDSIAGAQANPGAPGASAYSPKTDAVKPLVVLTGLTSTNTDLDQLTGGDYNNTPVARELAKRTGVTFKYITVAPEDTQNKLRLLIAARDLPDVFGDGGFSSTYPGGASRAAEDGLIVKLNPYLDTLALNYKKAIALKPEYQKNVIADNGDIYGFACLRGSKLSTVFFGPMIRKDILDRAGVPVPETIDEWRNALQALKDGGCKTPYAMLDWYVTYSGAFVGAYGCCTGYYIGQDGKVHFGAAEEGFRKYLELFHSWYQDGLIDPDFLQLKDQYALDVEMISGRAGACLNWISRVKKINDNGGKILSGFKVVATKYPVLNKGDKPLYAQADNPVLLQYFVSATGKHIEDAIRWYDYGYSEEGQMLLNFGILGESYTIVNGRPVYTDLITKDPNAKGWTTTQSRMMYIPIAGDAPTVESTEYFNQLALSTPEQKTAAELWSDAQLSSELPLLSFTDSEQKAINIQGDIDTYVSEATAKFILGDESLEQWNEYVKHIGELGLGGALAAYNQAYGRCQSR